MSTVIAIAGIRKRNSHALKNDAMSGVWIRKLGRSVSGANSSRITRNTPASFGFTTIISSLNKSRSSSRIRTTNRPWRGEDVELGLTWAAWQFAVDHGLLEDLQETFGEDTGTELLRFAIYRLCGEDSGMMNYADWLVLFGCRKLLRGLAGFGLAAQPLSSQRISEQLAVVDQSLMDRYFKRRHDRLLKARQRSQLPISRSFLLLIPPASALTQRPSPRLPMAMPDRILICGK